MPKITIELTDERYDALTKTAELHLPDGTPEEYLQGVIDSACDSYAQTNETVAAQVYKDRAEQAEAAKKAAEEREAAAKAAKEALEAEKTSLLAELDAAKAETTEKVVE